MITSSAPGSMIIFGEHSVLRGKHAIILAINKRIHVNLEPRKDDLIYIESPLGQTTVSLNNIVVQQPLQYVLQTLKTFPLTTGLNIKITSEMSPTMGFGTSAAVVVALLAGLITLAKSDIAQLFSKALQVVRQVQGIGSGADIMASIKGGIGLFQNDQYQPLAMPVELFYSYSGSKKPTSEVVNLVANNFANHPELLQNLDNANDALTLEATKYLTKSKNLGELFNISAGIMEAFGVHTKALENFLWELREQSCGAKLSGSGLGDCAIGVVKNGFYPKDCFPIVISPKGLKLHG